MRNPYKYYILAELREKHDSILKSEKIYNDYVSQKSMLDLASCISSLGYDCSYIGGMSKLINLFNSGFNCKNTIFINYNYGLPSQFKRGQSPIILEMMHAKYSGSDPFVSLLVNDKYCSKKLIENINISTPKSILIISENDVTEIKHENISLPLVVKPNAEGSSLGIDENSLCYNYDVAKSKSKELLIRYGTVLVEEYISGYEITVWIIGNKNNYMLIQPLSISVNNQYFFDSKIITMNDKANHTRSYSLSNNLFSPKQNEIIIDTAKKIFETLGMRDYGRIDFRFDGKNLYFIEANALPIFSKSSEIGQIMQLCKIKYEDICDKFITTVNNRLLMPETN